ncbi:hypothetical protein CSHISOI_10661 [Colletotrichum shisoi]|uniref:Uncharacterized protein n=1 Tax=Colletotrichum shisoi TaxID=2078593 RepID=A0A5Q4BDK1_9PEZI|nr:hypothetical protein CSHISOI_10661 [Colletotrichum shisoi]
MRCHGESIPAQGSHRHRLDPRQSCISAIAAEASIVDTREAITMTSDDRGIAAAPRPFCISPEPQRE